MTSYQKNLSSAVSLRQSILRGEDEIVGDQRAGFIKQEYGDESGQALMLRPPDSVEPVPRTSLLERVQQRANARSLRLRFKNSYHRGVSLAVGYYRPGCPDGGDWAKSGWYRLEPGEEAFILETDNQFATFFAEADDRHFWAGEYVTNVPLQAFDWCWNTASSAGENVGMRLTRVGTVNLVQ